MAFAETIVESDVGIPRTVRVPVLLLKRIAPPHAEKLATPVHEVVVLSNVTPAVFVHVHEGVGVLGVEGTAGNPEVADNVETSIATPL
jgi:hypothetical protein